VRFSAADERCGIQMLALLHDTRDDLRARRLRERFELREFRFDGAFRIAYVDGDQNRALPYVLSGRKRSMSQESPSL
jgi:hypothetical protein